MEDATPNSTSPARQSAVRGVVEEYLERRHSGDPAPPETIISSHGDLMPELGVELSKLEVVLAASAQVDREQSTLDGRAPRASEPETLIEGVGRFELIERIGSGGFGTVWKARDTVLDRIVAVKMLHGLGLSPPELERFTREAQASAQLRHPAIVPVHDIGREGDRVYLVSEFIEGNPLSQWMIEQHPSPGDSAGLCVEIARALHHAHEAHVIHRDLKPQNILIDSAGRPHVLDFGLARRELDEGGALAKLTLDGQVLGTPAYMSPEQAGGEGYRADRRTDIYSVGVMLFEMLTGELPFRGSARSLLRQVMEAPPPSPSRINATVPRDLEAICLKCLEKSPEQRYSSAEELAVDLERFLAGQRTAARLPGLPARVRRSLNRHPVMLTVVIALVLMAAIVSIMQVMRRGQGDRANTTGTAQSARASAMAILPLANAAVNPGDFYFGDGVTSGLIDRFSRVSSLRIPSRSVITRFTGRAVDPRQICAELQVGSVLTGSVQPQGEELLVHLELFSGSGQRLWDSRFTQRQFETQTVQSEIVRAVCAMLGVARSEISAEAPDQHVPPGDAYRLYLKGRYHLDKYTLADLRLAQQCFEAAIEKDREYGDAYCSLGDVYCAFGTDFLPPRDVFPRAKQYVEQALRFNPKSAEALMAKGAIQFAYDWDIAAADASFRKAVALDPKVAETHGCFIHYLDGIGQTQEAIETARRALELNPLSPFLIVEVGCASYYARKGDDAVRYSQRALDLDGSYFLASFGVARGRIMSGKFDEAIELLEKARAPSGDWPWIIAELGYAYSKAGRRDKAIETADMLARRSNTEFIDPYLMAIVNVGMGENELAMASLQKAEAVHSSALPFANVEAIFDPLRSDPRFTAMLQRIRAAR